jgi:hypothetical protein
MEEFDKLAILKKVLGAIAPYYEAYCDQAINCIPVPYPVPKLRVIKCIKFDGVVYDFREEANGHPNRILLNWDERSKKCDGFITIQPKYTSSYLNIRNEADDAVRKYNDAKIRK